MSSHNEVEETWWCVTCQDTFVETGTPNECTECGSSSWVPYTDPEETTDEPDDEFSGSKNVVEYDYSTLEREDPRPNVQQLSIVTEDGWEYLFREPNPNDGYELHKKFDSTGNTSTDDVVPVKVAEFIDDMVIASLNYAKLVIHPSDGVYTPPGKRDNH